MQGRHQRSGAFTPSYLARYLPRRPDEGGGTIRLPSRAQRRYADPALRALRARTSRQPGNRVSSPPGQGCARTAWAQPSPSSSGAAIRCSGERPKPTRSLRAPRRSARPLRGAKRHAGADRACLSLVVDGVAGRVPARLVKCAGRQHEPGRCLRFRPPAVMDPRAVQAGSRRCRHRRLRLSTVRDDPRHDDLEFSPFSEDRSPLDDRATGGIGPTQSRQQGANRIVVHLPTVARPEVVASHRPPTDNRTSGIPGSPDPGGSSGRGLIT